MTTHPVVVETTGKGDFQVEVHAQGPTFYVDEPGELGGLATGPTPYDLLGAALGACTAMTMRLYARKKKLPLEAVQVSVEHSRDAVTGKDRFERTIYLAGPLDQEQCERILAMADRCPVGKTLYNGADLVTKRASTALKVGPGAAPDLTHVPAMALACEEFDATG